MSKLFVWCAIMSAQGPIHKKAEVVLTNQVVCDRLTCTQALLIQYDPNSQSELIAETKCLYKNPNQSED